MACGRSRGLWPGLWATAARAGKRLPHVAQPKAVHHRRPSPNDPQAARRGPARRSSFVSPLPAPYGFGSAGFAPIKLLADLVRKRPWLVDHDLTAPPPGCCLDRSFRPHFLGSASTTTLRFGIVDTARESGSPSGAMRVLKCNLRQSTGQRGDKRSFVHEFE